MKTADFAAGRSRKSGRVCGRQRCFKNECASIVTGVNKIIFPRLNGAGVDVSDGIDMSRSIDQKE